MSIQLVTYANQTVTPTNDAIIYERAIDQNGIFYGCNVTVTSNNVNITGGYGIICGREFVIQSESIAVTLAPSGTLDGRLYVRLDLADADNPIQLLTATGNTLPALEQDANVNYVNGTWEMELATFTVGVSALSDVVETYETILGTGAKIIAETYGSNKVLWADTPMFLTGSQTAAFTEKISEQKSGIVVVWSEYSGGQAQNYGWQYMFIPKYHVVSADSNMQGVSQIMVGYNFGYLGTKYYYVSDTQIAGHASNNATGTSSGITYTNNHWVLRYVIGV